MKFYTGETSKTKIEGWQNGNYANDVNIDLWTRVKHVPTGSNTMYQGGDQLAGTNEYGSSTDDTANWSIPFENLTFDKFMFADGNHNTWMMMEKSIFSTYFNRV